MNDYTQIDAALLYEIKAGRNATWAMVEATNKITKPFWHLYDMNGMRVVDRRLQALKKAGKICFTRDSGWILAGVAK